MEEVLAENLPFAVLALVAGGGFVALISMAVRKQRGTVLEKTLTGTAIAGAACLLLGLGGLVITSIANAQALNGLSGAVALIGLVGLVLTVLAGSTQAILRRRVARRT